MDEFKTFAELRKLNTLNSAKPPKNNAELLDQLADRGLCIEDRQKADDLLNSVTYYRLGGYWVLLMDDNGRFVEGATFAKLESLYRFDRSLRHYLQAALGDIEVGLVNQLVNQMAVTTGDNQWHTNPRHFTTKGRSIEDIYLKKTRAEIDKQAGYGNPIARYYTQNYSELPVWAFVEFSTFGQICQMFGMLRDCAAKRAVADFFGVPPFELGKWLRVLSNLRNNLAHNWRIVNRSYRPDFTAIVKPRRANAQFGWLDEIENRGWAQPLAAVVYLHKPVTQAGRFAEKYSEFVKKCTKQGGWQATDVFHQVGLTVGDIVRIEGHA